MRSSTWKGNLSAQSRSTQGVCWSPSPYKMKSEVLILAKAYFPQFGLHVMLFSLSDEKSLPFQELSMQIQHFCAFSSFWKVSFPPFHVHSIFSLSVRVVFAEDCTSFSFFPLCYSLSLFIPSPNTEWASIACVCGYLTLLILIAS